MSDNNNTSCCKSHDVKLRGPRGYAGTPGIQGTPGPQGSPGLPGSLYEVNVIGQDDIVVNESMIGNVQTFTIGRPKEFFYIDSALQTDISLDPSFVSLQYFSPIGYTTLTYTNSSSVMKTYKTHVSYEHAIPTDANNPGLISWVDAALIKTGGVILYEKLGRCNLSGFLFWGPAINNTIGSGAPIHNLIDNQGSNVQFRFLNSSIPLTTSFFFPVTLLPGQSVTLKFRTKNATAPGGLAEGLLKNAQMMIEEL